MSTSLELFYVKGLGNHIDYMLIFSFFFVVICESFILISFYFILSYFIYFFFFAHGPIEYEQFLNRCIWPIDGTLTSTITPCQSGPGNNGSKEIFYTPQRHSAVASPSDAV